MTLPIPRLLLWLGIFKEPINYLYSCSVCFEDIIVNSRIPSFISLFKWALFLAWQVGEQSIFMKEKRSQKANDFSKNVYVLQQEKCCQRLSSPKDTTEVKGRRQRLQGSMGPPHRPPSEGPMLTSCMAAIILKS